MASLAPMPAGWSSDPRRTKPRLSELCDSPVVVAFDPGETTGWSVMKIHPEALVSDDVKILSSFEHWSHGQVDCGSREGVPMVRDIFDGQGRLEYNDLAVNIGAEMEGIDQMLEIVDVWPGACVLIEDFIIRRPDQSRSFLSPVRITAGFDYGLYQRGYQSFRQQPSEAKNTATDDRLKSWGLYERAGGLNHARDADRHAITWLRKCSTKKRLREACWPHLYGTMQVPKFQGSQEFVTVYGPYYIPPNQTWKDVLDAEGDAGEAAQESRLAGQEASA